LKYCARFTAVRGELEAIWGNMLALNAVLKKSPFEKSGDYVAGPTTKWELDKVSTHKFLNDVFRNSNASVIFKK
jgi:hypothetical protein